MKKPLSAAQLAIDVIDRSICHVQVGAAIEDDHGIFSWGWNSVGCGFGEHAEMAAIRRANKSRLDGATIFIAGQRRRNAKVVGCKPCADCAKAIERWGLHVVYRDAKGVWK